MKVAWTSLSALILTAGTVLGVFRAPGALAAELPHTSTLFTGSRMERGPEPKALLDDDNARVRLVTVPADKSYRLVPSYGPGTGWVALSTGCTYRMRGQKDRGAESIDPGDAGFLQPSLAGDPVEFGTANHSECKVLVIEQKQGAQGPALPQPITLDYARLGAHHDKEDSQVENESLLIAVSPVDLEYTPYGTPADSKVKPVEVKLKPMEVLRIPAGIHQFHNASHRDAIFVRAQW